MLAFLFMTFWGIRNCSCSGGIKSKRDNAKCIASSIERAGESNAAKAHIGALALEELEGTPQQGLAREHVLVVVELAAGNGALAAAVELPEGAVVGLDEADVVQVDVVLGVGGGRVALAGGLLVGAGERRRLLQQLGPLGRGQRYGLLDQLVEVGAGFWLGEEWVSPRGFVLFLSATSA